MFIVARLRKGLSKVFDNCLEGAAMLSKVIVSASVYFPGEPSPGVQY